MLEDVKAQLARIEAVVATVLARLGNTVDPAEVAAITSRLQSVADQLEAAVPPTP